MVKNGNDNGPVRDDKDDDVNGIRLCLLQLGQETEGCGLHFSALIIRMAALSLDSPPYSWINKESRRSLTR